MHKWTLVYLLLFNFMCSFAYGQLNCKVAPGQEGGDEKRCFHRNGKVSTLEVWDQQHRWGNLKGFDATGKELFSYPLRKVGGHALVETSYYPNGQLQKAEYRSAPDGGIQYYHIVHTFDETGQEISRQDLSRPDGSWVKLKIEG